MHTVEGHLVVENLKLDHHVAPHLALHVRRRFPRRRDPLAGAGPGPPRGAVVGLVRGRERIIRACVLAG